MGIRSFRALTKSAPDSLDRRARNLSSFALWIAAPATTLARLNSWIHCRDRSFTLLVQIPGYVDCNDPPVSLYQECRLQPSGSAIVEKIVIPVFFHQFWNDDCDLPPWAVLF